MLEYRYIIIEIRIVIKFKSSSLDADTLKM